MNGLVMARMVLINHDGWRIMKDFKFFLSLKATQYDTYYKCLCPCWSSFNFLTRWMVWELVVHKRDEPSVNHLIAFLQPAKTRHSSVGRCSVQVHDHVVLRHHQLQRADHVAEDTHEVPTWLSHRGQKIKTSHLVTTSQWTDVMPHSCHVLKSAQTPDTVPNEEKKKAMSPHF